MKSIPKRLSARQKAFAKEFVMNGENALKAAISAGYSETYANDHANKLSENIGIQEEIEKLRAEIQDKSETTPNDLDRFLSYLLFNADICSCFNKNGEFLKPKDIPLSLRPFIQDLTVKRRTNGETEITRIRFYSKLDAAKILITLRGWTGGTGESEEEIRKRIQLENRREIDPMIKRATELALSPEVKKELGIDIQENIYN